MQSESSKKLFIFFGVLLLVLLIGPYFGIHLLGEPVIPEHAPRVTERPIPRDFQEDPLPSYDSYQVDEDIDDGEDQ